MKRKSYLQNAVLLTLSGLILRACGMFLRVWLAACLGSEGMGLYQLIFTAYGIFIALANSGVAVAASRLTAEELGRGRPACALAALHRVLWAALALGLTAGLAQGLLADRLARLWLGDGRAALALQLLAPSLPFMAVSAALRGYFLALRRVGPSVRAQLLEQLLRMALVCWLLPLVPREDLRLACAAVVLGNVGSEVLSCLWMLGACRRQNRRQRHRPPCLPENLNRRLWAILAPVEGSRVTESLLRAAENALIPACLLGLMGREAALSAYGALRGMAMPLMLFPFSFLGALSSLLMPEITEAHVQGRRRELCQRIDQVLLLTGAASVLAGGLFWLYGEPLAQLLYRDAQAGYFIRVLSPVMPFVYLESMVDGVMKGMGEQLAGFRYNLWDSLLRIGAILALLPRFGLEGLLVIIMASNVLLCVLNTRRMLRVSGTPLRPGRWFWQPLFLFGLSALAGRRAEALAVSSWGRLLAGGCGCALCFVLLWSLSRAGREFLRALAKQKSRSPAGTAPVRSQLQEKAEPRTVDGKMGKIQP